MAATTLAGRVEAPGHVPVPGARVVLIDVRTRQRKLTWTDETGNYRFTNLPPGTYALIISLIGFRPSLIRSIAIAESGNQDEDVSLQLAMPGEQTPMTGAGSSGQAAARAAAGGKGLPLAEGAGVGLGMEALSGNALSSESNAGLRFSQGAAAGVGAETGAETSGAPSLQLSASADNSFLLTGNVVNVPAPSQQKQKWKEQRMLMRSKG
ncbi:MAG: carboxypeptidase-like regulatory domain-containing protein, partial [Terriglobia bacterium]